MADAPRRPWGAVPERPGLPSVLDMAARLCRDGQPFVLATVVWRRRPSSGRPGSKAIVLPDGSVRGWIGGACASPTLIRQARAALEEGRPRLAVVGATGWEGEDLGEDVVRVPMSCESDGALEIYLEPVFPPPRVVAVGRAPLVEVLASLAGGLGWTAETIDEEPGRAPGSPGPLPELVADARTAIIVATQGHYDEDALRAALRTEAGYIGLVASRQRAAAVFELLRATGITDAALARVHAPAGLDLGSVEPPEIAVAVLAELVRLRAAGGLRPQPAPAARAPSHPVATGEGATGEGDGEGTSGEGTSGEGATGEGATGEAVDPVCGMLVDIGSARQTLVHAGQRYYFCSERCRRAFEADPAGYLEPAR